MNAAKSAKSAKPAKSVKMGKPAKPSPGFDFAALETRIIAATKLAFKDVRRVHAQEHVCAFAIYSDSGAMTVCPAFDLVSRRDQRVADHQDDASYYTFASVEWALEGFGGAKAFNDICTTVRTVVLTDLDADDSSTRTRFASFKQQLFETCKCALEKLRSDGAFNAYPDLLVMFAVSDEGDLKPATELRIMQRLNPGSPYVSQFRRWTKTWGR